MFLVELPGSFSTALSKHLDAITAQWVIKNDSDCKVFAVKNVKSAFSEGEDEPVYSYVGRLLF